MKTKFTIIVILSMIAIATSANERGSNAGKLHFLSLKQALMKKDMNKMQLKHYLVTENYFSVPGFSEDYSWDEEANDWVHVTNTTYSYDEAGRVTEEIVQDAETDYYLSRNSYEYDEFGNVTQEIAYLRGVDEWIAISGDKSTYLYNNNSEIVGVVEEKMENGEWANYSKSEYTLNSNGIPTDVLTYNWNGTDWELHTKSTNVTWGNWQKRQISGYTLQYMNGGEWQNGERYSSIYSGANYEAITENWNNTEWVFASRQFYSINDTEEIYTLGEWTESGWRMTEKYTTQFDELGNQTSMIYAVIENENWVNAMEFFFDLTYNETNDVTEMVFRYRDPDLEAPINVTMFRFSSFLHIITDVPDISILNNVKVYPNPASTSFSIQIDEPQSKNYHVSVVNLFGQTVYSQNFTDPMILINAEQFVSGMYLLFIKTDDGKTYNSKLLKN